jgi:hypothetical protein
MPRCRASPEIVRRGRLVRSAKSAPLHVSWPCCSHDTGQCVLAIPRANNFAEEANMTLGQIIVLSGIVLVFASLAFTLALVDYQTAEVRKKNSVPLPGDMNGPDLKDVA